MGPILSVLENRVLFKAVLGGMAIVAYLITGHEQSE